MRGNNESVSAETCSENPTQQVVAEVSTVVCDVVNVTQAENVCNSSLAPPNEIYLITESETDENHPNTPQSIELVDRPSSQFSTHSEQNPWQTKKRKNKKRKRSRRIENLNRPLYGFGILANLKTE